MNVTINIYGDVHIHCDCCDECGSCGEYADDFAESLEVPDVEGGEEIRLSAEEAEDVVKAVAQLLLPFLSAEIEE
jgi:hypothetical protein